MPTILTPQIPASQLVSINPSVLSAGGQTLQFDGLILDSNVDIYSYPVLPIGSLHSFSGTTDVQSYFGATSQEAGLSSVYFTGPVGATKLPNALYASGYALTAAAAYLRGGTSTLTLSQLQAVDASMTVTIDGTPTTQTINLSGVTSFSGAANLIGSTLGIKGIQIGSITASLTASTMTVTAIGQGVQHMTGTANITGTTTLTVTANSGYLQIGDVVTGTGIPSGTTVTAYGGAGAPGGVGSYTLSQAATNANGVAITSFASGVTLGIGMVITGTGIPAATYISALGTGTGGLGTYTTSNALTTESAEAVAVFAPGVTWNAQRNQFSVNSGTTGTGSSVAYATGAAAATLSLTQATGAVQSLGTAAAVPATLMNSITAITQNWVSFTTTWEPTDADKEAFATWVNGTADQFVYEMWETNVLDTESGGPSAPVALVNTGDFSGVDMIYTNPAITTLAAEKAVFAMSWAACLDFTRLNGRSTAAFKSYVGGLPDVTNGTIAETLGGNPQSGTQGWGINFYGAYTTRTQGFPQWQRGFISGPFEWKDSYVNQIWLNNALQQAVMVGLAAVNSVPYAAPGYATIESWCLDPITAAVNFGAIVAGVQLSQAQIQEVNAAAGLAIDGTLFQRGWYLQVVPATAAIRALRTSPSITLWYCDGGAIQSINIASIEIQ